MTYDSSPRLNLFMIRLTATNTHTHVEDEIMNDVGACWQHVDHVAILPRSTCRKILPIFWHFCFPSESEFRFFRAKTMIRRIDSIERYARTEKRREKIYILCDVINGGDSRFRNDGVRWNGNVEHENISFLTKLKHHSQFTYARASFEHDSNNRTACSNDAIKATILLFILSILIFVMSRFDVVM